MTGSDKVINDVGGRSVAASGAEPFATSKASDDTARVVNTTISMELA